MMRGQVHYSDVFGRDVLPQEILDYARRCGMPVVHVLQCWYNELVQGNPGFAEGDAPDFEMLARQITQEAENR